MQIRFRGVAGDRSRRASADVRNFIQTSFDGMTQTVTTTAGNPYLTPAVSDQTRPDLTNGISRRSDRSPFNGFYKWIHNFFYQDITTRDITSNGVTLPVIVRGPANFDGTGEVRGFEIAYQQTYDFLPGLLSGLGMQASYTYIDSPGLPELAPQRRCAGQQCADRRSSGNLPLEQLSEHNVNVAAFYEHGPGFGVDSPTTGGRSSC